MGQGLKAGLTFGPDNIKLNSNIPPLTHFHCPPL